MAQKGYYGQPTGYKSQKSHGPNDKKQFGPYGPKPGDASEEARKYKDEHHRGKR